MPDPTAPPTFVPQPYPLWYAGIDNVDASINIGRVIAWRFNDQGELLPVVALQLSDDAASPAGTVDDVDWYLGNTRREAESLADEQVSRRHRAAIAARHGLTPT